MSAQPGQSVRSPRSAHLVAVARSLNWADASAARGDFADALAWLRAVEAMGDLLPDAYLNKRRRWHGALAQVGVQGRRTAS
jgi:hypothetical protein